MLDSEQLLLISTFVLVVLLALMVGLAVLVYKYMALQSRFAERVEQRFKGWREQEIDRIRREMLALARREAETTLAQWKNAAEQAIRQDAIAKSQAVTLGKVTEHFVPFLPDFGYNPKDARFLGSPIDFLVFDGLNEGEVRRIVFVEVKTGAAVLSAREKRVREAVQAGRVEWLEFRPGDKPLTPQ